METRGVNEGPDFSRSLKMKKPGDSQMRKRSFQVSLLSEREGEGGCSRGGVTKRSVLTRPGSVGSGGLGKTQQH